MTTIVNTPAPAASNDSGGIMGAVVGVFLILVVGYVFFMYGLPAIQHMQWGTPQINIPSKIDVNVNQSK